MEWFIAVVAIAALGVAAMAAAGGGGEMSEPVYDVYRATLPDQPLSAADLKQLRFAVGFRGYAMDQVDDLLDRLAHEIALRDTRIAELTGGAPAGGVPLDGAPAEGPPQDGTGPATEGSTVRG